MSIDSYLERYNAQEILFAERPRRMAIGNVDLNNDAGARARVNVWRNHAFETVADMTLPYARYAGYELNYTISDYDDALLFLDHASADIELLWLDSGRYLEKSDYTAWRDWLVERIKALRTLSRAPIVVATWLPDPSHTADLKTALDALPAVFYADLQGVSHEHDVALLDARVTAVSGSPLAAASQPLIARELACHGFPALLRTPIKAIALDLDNTLYAGVLGEDGIDGVKLSEQHHRLQADIKTLREHGIFITLVSRNIAADVEALFRAREDFPLSWSDFSATAISWDSKATAIERIAGDLRIATDAILFVDDNPGELTAVVAGLPGIHTVYAHPDADVTRRSIGYYPGLWRWQVGDDDVKRLEDMKANATRASLLEGTNDPGEYFRSLGIALAYRKDPQEQQGRIHDLCNKTNQFNLAFKRPSQIEVDELLKREDASIVTVRLSDRLSDSGVIATVIGIMDGETLNIEELCISCRALGRRIESAIVFGAIKAMPLYDESKRIVFNVNHGPRNQPALDWLTGVLGRQERIQPGRHCLEKSAVNGFKADDGITLITE